MVALKIASFVFSIMAITPYAFSQPVDPAKRSGADRKGYASTEDCQPAISKEIGGSGKSKTIKVAFLVGIDGKAKQSKIVKSSGRGDIDQVVLASFQKCSFHPAWVQGEAVISWVILSYELKPTAAD